MAKRGSFLAIMRKIMAIKEAGVFLILIILMAFLSIFAESFLTLDNILTIVLNMSFIAIMTYGMTLVIITAGIDLSVGSILGLSGVIIGVLVIDHGWNPFLAVLAALGVASLMGFTNGILITKARLVPFVSTLGMLSIGRGLAYVLSGGWPISGFSEAFTFHGLGKLGIFPMPVVYMAILGVIMHFFLKNTIIGRRIYAVGGNPEAATLMGIKKDRILILVYTLSGFFSGFSGFLMTAWLGVSQANAGQGYELDVIAATIIGGTSLMGGEGSIIGSLLGAAIMAVLRNGLILMEVSSFWQQVTIGTVIVLAIMFDQFRRVRVS